MNTHLAIYLAGNIPKGHEKESTMFWTAEDRKEIQRGLAPCVVSFLNPATRTDSLSDQKSVFGRDMTQVFCANVVFVDARERRGLGVGAEMMWAKVNRLPVLILAPRNSHYRKKEVALLGVTVEDWVHPFIESLGDAIVDNLEEGVAWLKKLLLNEIEIKGPESIEDAMNYYQQTQFPHDVPMRELIESNPELKKKVCQPILKT